MARTVAGATPGRTNRKFLIVALLFGAVTAALFYAVYLYSNAFTYNQMGYACALAVILFVIIFAVSLVELRGSRRWVHYEGN